ncbi:MAG: DUF115 domain-containing protein [Deltaproteobacteria bacterium]|nr:DUF115 domain-containing protein [Deltaproteobacteria bacterium]
MEGDALVALCAELEDLAKASDELCQAVNASNHREVRRLYREVAPAIAAALGPSGLGSPSLKVPPGPAGAVLIRMLQEASARIIAGQEALRAFRAPPSVPEDDLLRSERGAELLANALLPLDWEPARDLIALVGRGGENLAKALIALGQERVIVYSRSGMHALGLPREVTLVQSLEEVGRAVDELPGELPKQVITKRLPDPEITAGVHERVVAALHESFEAAQARQDTIRQFGELWIEQAVVNLPAIARSPSIDLMQGLFTGRPMVIIAPGPSLRKNVHLLPKFKGRAILVTFSHALAALQRANVVPDLVLALDPEDLSYHFNGYRIEEPAALVLGARVCPKLFALPARRVLSFPAANSTDDWIYDSLGDKLHLASGGSVAHAALSLGLALGCNPIVFVGQDLSFDEGQLYVSTSCDGETRLEVSADGQSFQLAGYSEGFRNLMSVGGAASSRKERLVTATGYFGGAVPTSATFRMFRDWFSRVARAEAGRTTLYNCTEGGVHIDGMLHEPLEGVLSLLPEARISVDRLLDGAVAATCMTDRRRAALRLVERLLPSVEKCIDCVKTYVLLAPPSNQDRGVRRALETVELELASAIRQLPFHSIMPRSERLADTLTRIHQHLLTARAILSPGCPASR